MSSVNSERIPNNVHLGDDKRLQRALEAWQPNYIQWWREMGPSGFQEDHVYLRTADRRRLRRVGELRLREDARLPLGHLPRRPGAGSHHRLRRRVRRSRSGSRCPASTGTSLRRLIVTQGDTEPASVEQQRMLGHSCPSVYDLRNLFQVNVEEGRHLWAMVYLLALVLRARRPRGGRGAASPPQRRRRQAAHARRVQRAVHRLALVLHVHVLHGSRRQVPAPRARRERVRSAVAHDAVHAHRGGAPHVRRRDRRAAHPRPHGAADGPGAGEQEAITPTTSASWASSICRRCRST